ncbi:hypothetical protein DFH09DRAFT_1106458 [Mycena vulgaris]|nr:hypothetical protein DFH09DRAFT_1106458 [Mycena vulgaris]
MGAKLAHIFCYFGKAALAFGGLKAATPDICCDCESRSREVTKGGAKAVRRPASTRIREPSTQEIAWLKGKITHAKFASSHNKILQNADRVEYWRFVFAVDEAFYKKPWPKEISNKMIPKGAIRKALDMGNTAFTEATQMIGIINTYTAEGPNFSQEVVDQITRSNEEDSKATELKGFLQDWQRHHSNQ